MRDFATSKAELLERIDESWGALISYTDGLTEDQLTGPTDAAGWTVNDHLAHIAIWERMIVFVLNGKPPHEGLGVDAVTYNGELDTLNEAIRKNTRDLDLPEVRSLLDSTHAELRAMIEALPEEFLWVPYAEAFPDFPSIEDQRRVIAIISGDMDEHYDEHLPWIRAIVDGA